jgi:hypothetical protein
MRSIVSIGESALLFAEFLASYPEYNTYTIGHSGSEFKVPIFSDPERYDEPINGLRRYLSTVSDEVTCVISGGETVSLTSLKVLEQLRDKKVDIVYLQPKLDLLNQSATMAHNLVHGVTQEMARSKVFNRWYLFDLDLIKSVTPNVVLTEMKKSIASSAARHYHTFNWLRSQDNLFGIDEESSQNAVISSISYCDFDLTTVTDLGKLLFIREQEVFYGISEQKVKTDTELYDKVVKSFSGFKKEDVRTSFKVFSVPYEEDLIYVKNSTTAVQNKVLVEAIDKASNE